MSVRRWAGSDSQRNDEHEGHDEGDKVTEAGWSQDPSGRHQERWFDGSAWSSQVRDHGVANDDPAGVPAGGPTLAGVSTSAASGYSGPSGGAPTSVASAPPTGHAPGLWSGVPAAGVPAYSVPVVERTPAGTPSARPAPVSRTPRAPVSVAAGVGGGGGSGLAVLGANSVVSGLLAGGIGGGLGMAAAEVFYNPDHLARATSLTDLRVRSGIRTRNRGGSARSPPGVLGREYVVRLGTGRTDRAEGWVRGSNRRLRWWSRRTVAVHDALVQLQLQLSIGVRESGSPGPDPWLGPPSD